MIHMSQVKVPMDKVIKVSPAELIKHGIISEAESDIAKQYTAKVLRIKPEVIKQFQIRRKSMDARRKDQMHFIYQVEFECSNEKKVISRYGKNDAKLVDDKMSKHQPENASAGILNGVLTDIIIVGMGPAGLFAALELARAGLAPTVIERGMDVDSRQQKVEAFWQTGVLDTECNVQFGEGGAGTFSDGKLNTMVKDRFGYNRRVLETFVQYGAPSEILYLQKPHIGTDLLRGVVKSMREQIIAYGGKVRFNTRFEDIEYADGKISAVNITDNTTHQSERLTCDRLILATGHSSRDTFYKMNEQGLLMQPKPFAIGVRVEHPQDMIGINQYGSYYDKLPTADYKLTYTTREGRGVYSFCMCPGGYVVNASSEPGRLVVNGMSNYARNSKNANSAIVVTVTPEDFGGSDALAGVAFQRRWEEAAYKVADGKIPLQLLGDYKANKVSNAFGAITPETKGEYAFGNVRQALPEQVADAIAEGMDAFERKIKGYSREDALMLGIESRTSSPVKILRDDTLQANIHGIYPCGEGAGYAGGITSAAMDGIKVAETIISELR